MLTSYMTFLAKDNTLHKSSDILAQWFGGFAEKNDKPFYRYIFSRHSRRCPKQYALEKFICCAIYFSTFLLCSKKCFFP